MLVSVTREWWGNTTNKWYGITIPNLPKAARNQHKLTSVAYLYKRYGNSFFMLSNWGLHTNPGFPEISLMAGPRRHPTSRYPRAPQPVSMWRHDWEMSLTWATVLVGAGLTCVDIHCHVDFCWRNMVRIYMHLRGGVDLEPTSQKRVCWGFNCSGLSIGKQTECSMIWAHCSKNTTQMNIIHNIAFIHWYVLNS